MAARNRISSRGSKSDGSKMLEQMFAHAGQFLAVLAPGKKVFFSTSPIHNNIYTQKKLLTRMMGSGLDASGWKTFGEVTSLSRSNGWSMSGSSPTNPANPTLTCVFVHQTLGKQ